MDLIQFLVLFLILFTVDMLRSRYPKLWRKIETPYLVALSAGGAVLVGSFCMPVCGCCGGPRRPWG